MNRIATSALFMLVLTVAGIANAQMGGGGHHGGGTTPGNSPQGGMRGPVAVGAMAGIGGHRGLIVGTDGTVYTIRVSTLATSTEPASFEVVAVRSSGAVGWTASMSGGMTLMELSGDNLLVTTASIGPGMDPDDVPTSSLVALSTASGATQWTLQLDGVALDLEAFAGGTYVTVVKFTPVGDAGGMHGGTAPVSAGARTLLSVGSEGKVRWALPLSK